MHHAWFKSNQPWLSDEIMAYNALQYKSSITNYRKLLVRGEC